MDAMPPSKLDACSTSCSTRATWRAGRCGCGSGARLCSCKRCRSAPRGDGDVVRLGGFIENVQTSAFAQIDDLSYCGTIDERVGINRASIFFRLISESFDCTFIERRTDKLIERRIDKLIDEAIELPE